MMNNGQYVKMKKERNKKMKKMRKMTAHVKQNLTHHKKIQMKMTQMMTYQCLWIMQTYQILAQMIQVMKTSLIMKNMVNTQT